jgi:hypothetical protein
MDSIERLERTIITGLAVAVDKLTVEDSFPHIERPSLEEMEIAIGASLANAPVPINIEAKLSRKPTWEMLNEFCDQRGLTWEKDTKEDYYIFRVKKFGRI